jgi:hypothetical protein
MLLGNGRGGLNIGPGEAAEVALRGPADASITESAKEKVVFCSRTGETLVFQADRQNRSAALCACGNASAAAAALLAQRLNRTRVDQDLHMPDGRLEMRSEAAPTGDGGWRVEQAWTGFRFHVREADMHGRRVAVCTGSFNDYLVVLLGGAAELEQFDLPEVLALWRQARQYSGFDNPLQSRLVALAPQAGGRPFAKFYTCGRPHPGAPLTGLATLAMASSRVNWLASLLEGSTVEHRRGTDPLPSVRAARNGFEIGFPAIDVHLHGI